MVEREAEKNNNVHLEMRNLKQIELQWLKNRGKKGWGYDTKKIDNENQCQATLKRLQRGDENQLEKRPCNCVPRPCISVPRPCNCLLRPLYLETEEEKRAKKGMNLI